MKQALKRMTRRRVRPQMLAALQNLAFEAKAGRIARRSARAFRALAGKKDLKVHVGAGDDIRLGWVNVDLRLRVPPQIDPKAHPDTYFINHDLRRGLPLPDDSCAIVYSSHFWEHLSQQEGLALMRDCHRALRPGGVFRISLPAFERMFEAYLKRDESYFDLVDIKELLPDVEPETLTLVDHVNYGVYQYGEHKIILDEEKTISLLRQAGFGTVAAADYKEGIDPPSPLRRRYSFYVEAVK